MKIIDGKDLANMKFVQTENGLLKEYKPERFIPKKDEEYWYIGLSGNVYSSYNTYEGDSHLVSHNFVFQTKEEAKDYKWFLEKLDEYKKEFTKEEWENGGITKCYLIYNYEAKSLYVKTSYIRQQENTHYFTKENIYKFIKEVGEYRIKKYMFNIWS